ncbi:MAG: DNA primase catalytic subunit PriS [Euryarchaeota archaeon]|nr:DNA primase catalytic subunit PriS [Euryarchaeota archaeon]
MGLDQEFLIDWFHRFYKAQPPRSPPHMDRREFGFMFFDRNFVQRHMGFATEGEMQSFLISQVPAHVYHSAAYYHFPSAPTMNEKRWGGADLIFDLDADHMKGADSMSYEDMLARIKVELIRLIDDFLLGDFGVDVSDLKIVFSGGRGYHIHVSDERIIHLKSHERREIVDYVSGTDLNIDWVFPERVAAYKTFQGRTKESRIRSIPSPSSGGWKKRLRTGIEWLIEDMRARDVTDLKNRFPTISKINNNIIQGMLNDLYDRSQGTEGAKLMLENNVFAYFSDRRHLNLFMSLIYDEVRPRFRSEIDEPVTSDIKRLIRLPQSLHGKTGLKVVPMSREILGAFEPLRDAVPNMYPDDEIEIFVKGRQTGNLRGQRYDLEGLCEAPLYLAIFLIARREATLEIPSD